MRKNVFIAAILLVASTAPLFCEPRVILPLRERAQLRDSWLKARLERLAPVLMRREGIDLWIVVSREYNEDPVSMTMLPSTWMAARRRTILLLHDPGPDQPLQRLAVARYDIGEFFKKAWDPEVQPDQWKRLAEIVEQINPEKIALDFSAGFALADGISSTEMKALSEALPERFRNRIVSGERLAIAWLETRIAEEMEVYPSICGIAHSIIAEGLSEKAIQPGHTTTADLEWWFREKVASLKLETWFHPSVSIQREDTASARDSFATRPAVEVIQRGDLVHVDFGISYLGLNTDTQQHAYVLRPGESDAPEGLRNALAAGNRLQDILTSNFKEARTGNEILALSLAQAKQEGLRPSIYTHPIGFHGHAAGPTIGMWDRQDGVPITGDYPLYPETAYSIELNVTATVPEWGGKEIRVMLEEDAIFTEGSIRYMDGRQTQLLLVR